MADIAGGTAIPIDLASGVGRSAVSVAKAAPVEIRSVVLGAGIDLALFALAALAALLFTAAVFGYPGSPS